MSDTKWTTGEWRRGSEKGFHGDGIYVGSGIEERRVAMVYGIFTNQRVEDTDSDPRCDEANANAHLIASAPALYAALEWLAEYVADGYDDVPPHPCEFVDNPEKGACEFHERWVDVVAALAQARGEKP